MTRLLVTAIAGGALLASAAVQAKTQLVCKSQPVPGVGSSNSAAQANWHTNAANKFGAAWADFSLAENVTWSSTASKGFEVILPVVSVTATPCRNVQVISAPATLGQQPNATP